MKTIEVKVFNIDELSEKQKEKAYDKWLQRFDYPWNSENQDTLKAFERIFPIKVTNWEYGYRKSIDWEFTGETNIEELSGLRLHKYILNNYGKQLFKGKYYSTRGNWSNGKYSYKMRYSKIKLDNSCVLTGYCMDDSILKPIYDFLLKPNHTTNFKDLLNDCLNKWLSDCHSDYEHSQSFDAFIEDCRANEIGFPEYEIN